MFSWFVTKYFVCRTSKIPYVDNDEKFRTKYSCSVFENLDDATEKLQQLVNINENINGNNPFITKTCGPMFYRQIQIQQNNSVLHKRS